MVRGRLSLVFTLLVGLASQAGSCGPKPSRIEHTDTVQQPTAEEQIDPELRFAVEAIVALFDHADNHVRDAAIRTIGGIGQAAWFAALGVLDVIKRSDSITGEHAVDTLIRLGPKAIPQLMVALEDDDSRVRIAAATALGEIGADTDKTKTALIPDLLTYLDRQMSGSGPQSV